MPRRPRVKPEPETPEPIEGLTILVPKLSDVYSGDAPVDKIDIEAGERLRKTSICVELRIHSPRFRKMLRAQDVLHATDKTDRGFIHIGKDLIDQSELKEIRLLDRGFKESLIRRSMECSIMSGGFYLMSARLIVQIDKEIEAFKVQRAAMVQSFADKYPALIEDARKRLGDHFDPDDYPAIGLLVQSFYVQKRYFSFDVPAALKKVNRALFDQARQESDIQWGDAANEVRDGMRVALLSLIERMTKALAVDADTGKRGILRDSTVDQFMQYMETFADRDLLDDKELAGLVEQAKQIMAGVDPKDLRKKDDVRGAIREQFDAIGKTLTTMVVPRERVIDLDGDED